MPVVVNVAFPTIAQTGREVVAAKASYVPMVPNPCVVLAVGMMMVSSRDNQAPVSASMLIGMEDRTLCKRVNVGPLVERTQST